MIEVDIIPVLNDNYCYIIHKEKKAIIIDPGQAGPVIEHIEKNQYIPQSILCTHHHGDHIAGNNEIKNHFKCEIVIPEKDKDNIKGFDKTVHEGNIFSYLEEDITVLETPGHTLGGVCYYISKHNILFTGDTLFSLGCGRLFEGTAQQMWGSLQKIAKFPKETKIYCGHEYTRSNAEFCQHIEPENQRLQKRILEIENLRSKNLPTLPCLLEEELACNVFLKAQSADEFKELRALKDSF